jgi:hypothetical protein
MRPVVVSRLARFWKVLVVTLLFSALPVENVSCRGTDGNNDNPGGHFVDLTCGGDSECGYFDFNGDGRSHTGSAGAGEILRRRRLSDHA